MQSPQAGATTTITLYKDPALTLGPSIVGSIVQSLADAFNGARAAAAVTVQLATAQGVVDQATLQQAAAGAAQSFGAAFQAAPPIALEQREPHVAGAAKSTDDGRHRPGARGHDGLLHVHRRRQRRPQHPGRGRRRHAAAHVHHAHVAATLILGGKFLSVLLIVLLQSTVLVVAGRLLFGIRWGGIGPVIALTMVGAIVATGLALLLLSFSRTPAQAGAFTSGVLVLLGLLGGNFIGTADLGGWFDIVRRLTPERLAPGRLGPGHARRESDHDHGAARLLSGLRRRGVLGGLVRAIEAVPMTVAGRDGRWSS